MGEPVEDDDKNDKSSSALPILPLEMVEEILTRLPIKSLMRFKCVSSSWRSLISERRFAHKHAEIWETLMAEDVFVGIHRNGSQHLEQYGVVTTSQYHLKSCQVHSLYKDSFVHVAVHDYQLLGREYYHIVGSSHGLICFRAGIHLYLWNPVTMVNVRLPNLDAEASRGDNVTYGFGYDQRNGDYKVVALLHQREVNVYSMKYGHWRNIKACIPSEIAVESSRPVIYINGTLNWVATRLSSSLTTIMSFNLSREMFKEVTQPVNCTKGCFTLTLGDLGGYLSMVCYCEGSKANVWVMKEFGKRDSWMKLVSIRGLTDYVRPLWISNQSDVLLELRSGLALYNSSNEIFTYHVAHGLSSCYNAKVFVKTLVSPNLP